MRGGCAEPDDQRTECRPVEPQGPNELDEACPPVDPAVLEREELSESPVMAIHQQVARRCRLPELQERGRGEEDGTDEVGHVVGIDANRRGVRGQGTEREHSEPTAKRTPIHQATAPGAHHVDPLATLVGCLRCHLDSHTTATSSA